MTGAKDDIDPARIDVIEQPKRRRKRKAAPMQPSLKPWVEQAERRARRRPITPGIMIDAHKDGNQFTAPHDGQNAWELQIADAFGTRSVPVMKLFLDQLAGLCGEDFDYSVEVWKPNEMELNAILAIVNSVRPKDESEAMLACHMCATHLMMMRTAKQALKGYMDIQTAATAGKLARTYVMQLDALGKLRGKGSSSRQRITVKHEKHVHHHQHVHIEGGGSEFGGQPHEVMDDRPDKNGGRAALPSPDQGGRVVPLRSGEGEAGLPQARRGSRIGRSNG